MNIDNLRLKPSNCIMCKEDIVFKLSYLLLFVVSITNRKGKIEEE